MGSEVQTTPEAASVVECQQKQHVVGTLVPDNQRGGLNKRISVESLWHGVNPAETSRVCRHVP